MESRSEAKGSTLYFSSDGVLKWNESEGCRYKQRAYSRHHGGGGSNKAEALLSACVKQPLWTRKQEKDQKKKDAQGVHYCKKK